MVKSDNINVDDLLAFIAKKYDTNIATIQHDIVEMKNKEILKQYRIWYQESTGNYLTWLTDENGRRLKQAKRKKKEDLEKLIINHHHNLQKTRVTIIDLYNDFLLYKREFIKPNTIQKYQSDWNRYFITDSQFVNKPFQAVKKTDIDAFLANIVNTYHLNTKAFNAVCSLLRQMFTYASDNDYIPNNPFRVKQEIKRLCKPTKRKASELETYTDEELQLLSNEMERRLLKNPINTSALGVMLCFELGLRMGELMGINIDDIDFENQTIFIHSQLSANYDVLSMESIHRNGYKIVDYTKTPQGERIIPITNRAITLIKRIMAINEANGFYCDNYLFVRKNAIIPPKAVESQLKRGCNHIGIPYRSPHKMRKTFASSLINNGVPITTVQELLGHSEPSTTLRYYTFDNSDKAKIYDNIKTVLNNRYEEKVTIK